MEKLPTVLRLKEQSEALEMKVNNSRTFTPLASVGGQTFWLRWDKQAFGSVSAKLSVIIGICWLASRALRVPVCVPSTRREALARNYCSFRNYFTDYFFAELQSHFSSVKTIKRFSSFASVCRDQRRPDVFWTHVGQVMWCRSGGTQAAGRSINPPLWGSGKELSPPGAAHEWSTQLSPAAALLCVDVFVPRQTHAISDFSH